VSARSICQLAGAFSLVVMVACADVAEDLVPAAEPIQPSPIPAGVAYLMAQQAEDGAWHSETYGSMKEGAAITSLILYSLAQLPPEYIAPHRKEIERAFGFLSKGIAKTGYVCNPDGTIDLPTYGSALTLTSASRLGYDLTPAVRKKLLDYLVGAQLTETREFEPTNPHYGGWDLTGAQKVIGQTSGTNVSLVRYVLEAFREVGGDDPAVAKSITLARKWIGGCQNFPGGDGGFFYTPEAKLQGNKAQVVDGGAPEEVRARSYGSATVDGIGCLLHLGADRTDERLAAGLRWLEERPSVAQVPGFESFEESIGWEQGLRFYYYSGLAGVLPELPAEKADTIRKQIRERLIADQRKDGSWQNESTRMREDDPLLCTAMALIALGGIR